MMNIDADVSVRAPRPCSAAARIDSDAALRIAALVTANQIPTHTTAGAAMAHARLREHAVIIEALLKRLGLDVVEAAADLGV